MLHRCKHLHFNIFLPGNSSFLQPQKYNQKVLIVDSYGAGGGGNPKTEKQDDEHRVIFLSSHHQCQKANIGMKRTHKQQNADRHREQSTHKELQYHSLSCFTFTVLNINIHIFSSPNAEDENI